MDAKWRFGATVVIWGLATLMAIVALGNAGLGWIEDWVVAVPLGVALVATLAVWESGRGDSRSSSSSKNQSHTDQKSDSTAYTMALLMEMMDDDEREEFKSQLKQRILSGESLTDASMVQEMEKRKRG
ncbi:MAG: hypothetical protein CUN52_08480 [Phototrophicales bacterium]|nr:MAG: hypothetical protein CUN52_08480 [Phototrophicales bacterium]